MGNIFRFLILFISINAFAQTETTNYIIHSKVFGDDRTISVFTPETYKTDSTAKLPVAYVFDGQFEPYTQMVSSIMSYYEQTDEGIPMIVVGIHSKDRQEEFIPLII